MGWKAWHASLADVVVWKPELGAAEALGLDPRDYPLHPPRDVEPKWTQECSAVPGPSQIDKVLGMLRPADPAAAVISGTGSQRAMADLRVLFPPNALGCPSSQE